MKERQNFTKEEKLSILKEVEEVGNIKAVSRRHGISDTTIHYWLKNSKELGAKKSEVSKKALQKLEKENNQLKKLLGGKDLKIAILEDLLKKN